MTNKFTHYIQKEYETCSWKNLYYGNIDLLLKQLVNPQVYVEIGIAAGWHIETILKEHKNLKCYGIDPYVVYDENDSFSVDISKIDCTLSFQENFDYYCKAVNERLTIYDNFTHIRKDSNIAAENFSDNSIDLLFIDGNHTYNYVKNDCERWWSKIRLNGIMCGDDYYWPEVKKAVDEFSSNKKLEFCSYRNSGYHTWYIKK